ncbi:MAG: sensor histidine kinase [Clostridia bacterium]
MQRKILITYVLLVLLLLTILFVVLMNKTAEDENTRHGEILLQANEIINGKLTDVMQDIRYSSAMYLVNQDMITAVENDFYMGRAEYVATLRELKKNVLSVKVNPNLSSIAYLTHSGQIFSGAGYHQDYLEGLKQIVHHMQKNNARTYVTPAYHTVINQQNVQTITYAFQILSSYTFHSVGYGFINIDMKKLAKNFDVLTFGQQVNTLAVQNGSVLFQNEGNSASIGESICAEMMRREALPAHKESTLFEIAVQGERFLCAATHCKPFDLTILNYVPIQTVNIQVYHGLMFYLMTVFLMLVVFAAVSFVLSIAMTKPIRVLQTGMKRVEQGDLQPITELVQRQDDMGELIQGFNQMVHKLHESILREYESKDMQRKAQIQMLQSQINPHFLYNTLNLITSIAELEDVPEISDIATSLGDLFRYGISGGMHVMLEEEVMQVERYIHIQRMCMNGELEVVYNIDPLVQQQQLPKFLLQPLVENCFQHGFAKSTGDGKIYIAAYPQAQNLIITVADDGAGIPPDKLLLLQARCAHPNEAPDGEADEGNIGMLNVNLRLRAYFGESYGLWVDSREGEGTTVTVTIPYHTMKEDGACV